MTGPNESTAALRPADYATLLREPISLAKGKPSYDGWEFDHGRKMHFYVGGMQWFMRASGIQRANELVPYGARAAEEVEHNTDWDSMPSSGNDWDDCSENQFRRARNVKPMFYQKAALVMLACELALADRIRTGRVRDRSITALDVYDKMSIIPACWHIDEFDRVALKRLTEADPDALTKLRDAAGQSAKTFVDHLALGYTATLPTAKVVKKFLDTNHPELRVGDVNPRPANGMSNLHATDFERIDAG